MRNQLSTLLSNFSPGEMSVIAEISHRMAIIKGERFTGQIILTVISNVGDVIDARVSKTERIKVAKK
ncbi:hypothetical protein JCM39068_28740 [Desulfocastanea catecholica]